MQFAFRHVAPYELRTGVFQLQAANSRVLRRYDDRLPTRRTCDLHFGRTATQRLACRLVTGAGSNAEPVSHVADPPPFPSRRRQRTSLGALL